jgi:D-threo-aldose 1-dehydrogenase
MTTAPHPGSADWHRPLPGTALTVTAICAGGSPLANMPGHYGHEVSAEQGVAVARAVLESPIRFQDTSSNYGDGESERRIGAAIREVGGLPADFVISTKVDPVGRDYSGDRVRASVDESRERLGLETLPLVHLHDPENFAFDEIARPGGAVDALVALKEAGVVGSIGLAGGPVQEMTRYLRLGVFDVLIVHNRWTLLDRSAGDLVAEARDRGMGVLNAAVYGGGLLTPNPRVTTYGYHPARPEVLDAVAAMRAACERHGTDITTAALQFSLRDPQVTSTIVGLGSPAEVADTLSRAAAPVPDELWDELAALTPPRHVWLDAPFA